MPHRRGGAFSSIGPCCRAHHTIRLPLQSVLKQSLRHVHVIAVVCENLTLADRDHRPLRTNAPSNSEFPPIPVRVGAPPPILPQINMNPQILRVQFSGSFRTETLLLHRMRQQHESPFAVRTGIPGIQLNCPAKMLFRRNRTPIWQQHSKVVVRFLVIRIDAKRLPVCCTTLTIVNSPGAFSKGDRLSKIILSRHPICPLLGEQVKLRPCHRARAVKGPAPNPSGLLPFAETRERGDNYPPARATPRAPLHRGPRPPVHRIFKSFRWKLFLWHRSPNRQPSPSTGPLIAPLLKL